MMNDEFLENVFDFLKPEEKEELDGYSFVFKCKFKIIDCKSEFCMGLSYLFKNSYKEKAEMEYIQTKFPMSVSEISGLELSDFDINKLYTGYFRVNMYTNKTFDVFLEYIYEKEEEEK